MLFNLSQFNGQFVPTNHLMNCGFEYFKEYLKKIKNKKKIKKHQKFWFNTIIFDY